MQEFCLKNPDAFKEIKVKRNPEPTSLASVKSSPAYRSSLCLQSHETWFDPWLLTFSFCQRGILGWNLFLKKRHMPNEVLLTAVDVYVTYRQTTWRVTWLYVKVVTDAHNTLNLRVTSALCDRTQTQWTKFHQRNSI